MALDTVDPEVLDVGSVPRVRPLEAGHLGEARRKHLIDATPVAPALPASSAFSRISRRSVASEASSCLDMTHEEAGERLSDQPGPQQ